MKSTTALLLAISVLTTGCAKDVPPPVIRPSFQYGAGQMRPTKREYMSAPTICPNFRGDVTVRLGFTLEPDGRVSHVRILDESHKGCGFAGEAAMRFRKWRFPPHVENGVAVAHEEEYSIGFNVE
jgi:TonB family protein